MQAEAALLRLLYNVGNKGSSGHVTTSQVSQTTKQSTQHKQHSFPQGSVKATEATTKRLLYANAEVKARLKIPVEAAGQASVLDA